MRAENLAQSLMQQVRGRVVARHSLTRLRVDSRAESRLGVGRHLHHNVDSRAVFTLGVDNFHNLARGQVGKRAFVAHLSAHLGIERCLGKYHLIIFAAFLLHVAVTQYLGFGLGIVVAYELFLAFGKNHPVAGLHGSGAAGARLLGRHLAVESFAVDSHSVVLED